MIDDDLTHRLPPDLMLLEGVYADPPVIDAAAWQRSLADALGTVTVIGDDPLLLNLDDHVVDYSDRAGVPAQVTVLTTDRAFDPDDPALAAQVQQSWDWPEADEALARGRHTAVAGEMLARGLRPSARLRLFRALAITLIETTGPLAVRVMGAGCVLEPQRWLTMLRSGDDRLRGLFNVRFFSIADSAGDAVMDTLGLGQLGVPDLQCHFRGLPPGEVAAVLHSTAAYLVEHGDVVQDGHTVPGVTPISRWTAQHEDSLVEPTRMVLDLCPEPPHAAGGR